MTLSTCLCLVILPRKRKLRHGYNFQVTVVTPENPLEPSGSPVSPVGRRAFKFSSLKKRVNKAVSANHDQSSNSSQATSEADIVAFQRELQNLPNFEASDSSESMCALNLRENIRVPYIGNRVIWIGDGNVFLTE